MTRLAAAIVGTGFMGTAHAEALRRIAVPIAGILGSTPEKSRRAADALGLPRAYASYDELLTDPAVAVVHLGTPNRLHFEQAKQALEAGKHVLCEKPLAMTGTQTAELVRIARQFPRQAAGVNYNVRFYPLCREARQRIRAGEIGPVFHVAGCYVQDWLLHPTDYNWRVSAEEGGELRAVADIGTHWLDLIISMTGLEIESLCADLKTVHPVRQRPAGEVETFQRASGATTDVPVSTDDYGAILLRFRGGARGAVWVSQVTAGRKNCLKFEIAGASASLAFHSERPDELWIGRRDRPNELLVRDPALLGDAARAATGYPGGHAEGFPDTFKFCFRAFYDAIAQNDFREPAYATFADGHREVVLCEAILRSQREGRWVSVEGADA